ncbi:AAEL004887-PA, partial [Aedes aegypti]
ESRPQVVALSKKKEQNETGKSLFPRPPLNRRGEKPTNRTNGDERRTDRGLRGSDDFLRWKSPFARKQPKEENFVTKAGMGWLGFRLETFRRRSSPWHRWTDGPLRKQNLCSIIFLFHCCLISNTFGARSSRFKPRVSGSDTQTSHPHQFVKN